MVTEAHERRDAVASLLALGAAARRLADGAGRDEALRAVADGIAAATGSDVALIRLRAGDAFEARAVAAASQALAAELQGSRVAPEADPAVTAEQLALGASLAVPITAGDEVAGRIELYRSDSYGPADEALARVAAEYAALALARTGADGGSGEPLAATELLRLGGDALASGTDEARTARQIAQLAAEATRAAGAVVWRLDDGGALTAVGAYGAGSEPDPAAVRAVLDERRPFAVRARSWTVQLGQPPLGLLELEFGQSMLPSDQLLDALTTFAARAAHGLRISARARDRAVELERSRALVAVVGQAIEQLSLAHTLETAVARVAELVGSDRLAVYLVEGEGDDRRLLEAAGSGLAGPHLRIAERLLELAADPARREASLEIADAAADRRLRTVRDQLAETGIGAVVAIPLRAADELIGLLAIYVDRGRMPGADTLSLVTALTAQLAVVVQNARLHEQVKQREEERRAALEAEQSAARTLGSLYEISRTFAQSLSLETTLQAIVRSMAELLRIDAVGIRMPDERGESLVTQELHVRDERLAPAVRAVLLRPQPFSPRLRRMFADRRSIVLDPRLARDLGGSYGLLVPFLEKASTTAIVPLSTQADVLGTLTLLSLDPARPLVSADIELALSVGGQAALALENARLYQQEKRFLDTMQRSLLPRGRPRVAGIAVGDVYAPSARVDVGGDVYDYLTLDDGRLAVVLGDVTGHGVDAAADMAMAKFVFRSLAREHSEPGEFLAAANEVVLDEVAANKFISMLYMTVDGVAGEVACACAGHPWPRIVSPAGEVDAVRATGLVLGVDSGQEYATVRHSLPPGGAVVLYTDGVIEARRDGELYGDERLDALLASSADLPAEQLARAVVADCRAFAGGELSDDCAVVVIRRTA
jgi:serine phosphatase RsbU (regulator of sigma subunit)